MKESQHPKKERVDGQMSGLAGEFFVAAELLKRGLQTSVTFGNAKAIDLFARDEKHDRDFKIQVKALRTRNYFLISPSKVSSSYIYVFVLLNKPDHPVQYFIVPGVDLVEKHESFGRPFQDPKLPGIHPKDLAALGYENAWHYFTERRDRFTSLPCSPEIPSYDEQMRMLANDPVNRGAP